MHPFPSVLDGLVSGAVAALAGAGLDRVLPIAAAMTMAQLGIGTLNDVVDAPRDAGRKPGKPIPARVVGRRSARAAAVLWFAAAVLVASTIAPVLAALTVVVIGIGLTYDLVLKGTAWSWVPFAVGVPILPVYGWLGATGTLAPAFAIVVPAAVAAGAALAIGNSLVDAERDASAGDTSVAVRLGPARASGVAVVLLLGVGTLAVTSAAADGAGTATLAIAASASVPVAAVLLARGRDAAVREWAWRVEAVGLALLAVTWVAVVLIGGGGR